MPLGAASAAPITTPGPRVFSSPTAFSAGRTVGNQGYTPVMVVYVRSAIKISFVGRSLATLARRIATEHIARSSCRCHAAMIAIEHPDSGVGLRLV